VDDDLRFEWSIEFLFDKDALEFKVDQGMDVS
jgi:hypothetical protein